MPHGLRESDLSTVEKGNVEIKLYLIVFQLLLFNVLPTKYSQRNYVPLSLVKSPNGENGVHLQKEEKN